jgi:hypothetical protein
VIQSPDKKEFLSFRPLRKPKNNSWNNAGVCFCASTTTLKINELDAVKSSMQYLNTKCSFHLNFGMA